MYVGGRIFTIYTRVLPLDVACRVWDMFCRDGDSFLFRTALGQPLRVAAKFFMKGGARLSFIFFFGMLDRQESGDLDPELADIALIYWSGIMS